MPSQKSVLIVDDDANFRNTLYKILGKKGYTVTVAENGPSAIGLVQRRSFDVILMDIKMPILDGVETCKNIKKICPDAVVIFMTAFSVEDLVRPAIRDGAYAVIKKPFDVDAVVNMIEKSRSGALIVVVDDDPNIARVMKFFLERNGYSTTTCQTGEAAIALAQDRPRDMFFIDMKLPVLNGLETYLEIKKVNPGATAVMMTGYQQAMNELVSQAIGKGAYTCLYKPFDMDKVLEIVEDIFLKRRSHEHPYR